MLQTDSPFIRHYKENNFEPFITKKTQVSSKGKEHSDRFAATTISHLRRPNENKLISSSNSKSLIIKNRNVGVGKWVFDK